MLPVPDRIRSYRRILAALLVVGLLLIVAFSNQFGRAQPTGRYDGSVPPPALTTGCYPLPAGVTLDFPHQVRTDDEVGGRRFLVLQYDLIDADSASSQVIRAFTEAGFRRLPGDDLWLEHPRAGRVSVGVSALDVPDDALVRGTIGLNLPATPRASDDPHCRDPYVTKRFPKAFLEVEE